MDKVVHFHIPVDDINRAKKFYTDIFGWEIQDTGMEQDYSLTTTVAVDEKGTPGEPGAINGALYTRESPDESPSIIINVPSIKEYLKKIENKGGRVVMPESPVEDFGLYAQFSDTEGNVIGLWQDIK